MGFGKSKVVVKKEDPKEEVKEEPKDEAEVEEEKEEYLVIKELPVQPVRKYKDPKTGKVVNLLTSEEALTAIANDDALEGMDDYFKNLTGGL